MTTQELQEVQKIIPRLHAAYCHATGLSLSLSTSRAFWWEVWCSKGWQEADLLLVIKHIKALIKEGRKWNSALHFRRLIEDTEGFEEMISEARAVTRNAKPHTDRDAVLASTGRTAAQTSTAKTPAQIMEDSKAFAQFKAWRQREGL